MLYLIISVGLGIAMLSMVLFGEKVGFPQTKFLSTKYRAIICVIIVLAVICDVCIARQFFGA